MKQNRPPPEFIEKVRKMLQEKEQKKRDFIEKFGHINPPNVIKTANNKAMSVIEGGIYIQTREESYNFANVIHDHALIFFGDDFIDQEELKPLEQRHPAIQWLDIAIAAEEAGNKPKMLGVEAAWYRLANDLFTIRDNAKLEKLIKTRLLNPLSFQGARHELRVAAVCIAAGFTLEFEDETDVTRSHPEFVAVDKFSSAKIIVEAKSRHRKGVLGFEEGGEEEAGRRVKIRNLVVKAYKKQTDLPLYVFVDVNLPPYENEQQFKDWLSEIDETMAHLDADGFADPCPANALFFVNDPSHFIPDRSLDPDLDKLWIYHVTAYLPKVAHPSDDIVTRLVKAFTQRISSPEEIDFQY